MAADATICIEDRRGERIAVSADCNRGGRKLASFEQFRCGFSSAPAFTKHMTKMKRTIIARAIYDDSGPIATNSSSPHEEIDGGKAHAFTTIFLERSSAL